MLLNFVWFQSKVKMNCYSRTFALFLAVDSSLVIDNYLFEFDGTITLSMIFRRFAEI